MAKLAADDRRPAGRRGKREAIARAARREFGREGYARTSIDAIAAAAGVSTRTIYNHFEGKEQLFSAVLLASATQVADGFAARVERGLAGADLRADLVALGQAFAAQRTDFPEHFALVGHIRTEAPHFPPATIEAWQQSGPLRVQREVGRRLAELADRGRLHVADPARAAVHFVALVSAAFTLRPFGAPALSEAETRDAVASGVDAFLDGYGTAPRAPVRA